MLKAFQYFRPYRLQLIPVVLASLLEMLFNAQIPLSVKYMIDRALVGHSERAMVVILSALAVGILLVSVTSMSRDYLFARIVSQISAGLRERMFEHLQRLSMNFYARGETADVMSRFSNDVVNVNGGLASGVAWGLQPLLDLILSAILIFSMEWRLATLGIILCPICILGPRLLAERAGDASVLKQKKESGMMTALQETLAAPNLVRAFNLEEMANSRFREANQSLLVASVRLGFLSTLMERSASLGTLLLQAIVMGISGYLAFRGDITIGTFASFQALFVSLSYSFMYLAQYTPNLVAASGGVERIEELLSEAPAVQDAPDAIELPVLRDAVEMRDVHFSYTGEQRNLDGVNLRIPRGASVAFVGPSGSGKSTMLNLLLRFYDPSSGSVMVDATDMRQATQASLRAQTSVVFQEGFLFNTSIRENLAMARPGATFEEIVEAAKAAEIHDMIAALPEGYETLAGERGSRFSGGQRQRLSIARAVLRNPSILLLDEATSALDPSTEHAINETLEHIAKGRTLISVTHRLSSVVKMDRIFLFNKGQVAEQGTHAEMLAAGGIYAKMWQKQSGLQVNQTEASVDPAWLGEISLMRGVSLPTLAEVARWFGTERFAAGRNIVEQGDAGDRFYILARGKVEIRRTDNGETRSVATLEDGDYFGEMALLTNQPRNATVHTLTDCVCLSLPRNLFERLMATEPELRETVRKVAEARGAA